MQGNKLTSLNVSGCTGLTYLEGTDNDITSLLLTGANSLTYLGAGRNNINSITGLSGLSALESLYIYNNNLSSIDVSALTALKNLDVESNNLSSLNVSANANLEYLVCSSNNLTVLNIQGLTQLYDLYCDTNKLSFASLPASLPVGGGTYGYTPQKTMDIALTNGNVVNLASEAGIGAGTVFQWYNASNDPISDGITSSGGVFTFSRTTYSGVSVHCAMQNASFSGLTITTSAVTIQNLPQLDTPSGITLSGSTFSWNPVANAASYKVNILSGGSIIREGVTTAATSVNLALLPGETSQTLESGSYRVNLQAIANPSTHLDSGWALSPGTAVISGYNPLQQVNAATTAAVMLSALESNHTALGINTTSGDYNSMTNVGKAAVANAMLAGKTYASNSAVATAFLTAVKKGVIADEAQKYETSVTLAYDSARADGADVSSLVLKLKSSQVQTPV